ncbi:glycosyltransferase family 2 protein [Olsenella urininfantis]|uniref:glycosyltransferase family 2 protein n=1 Tax=Olsenella urininfantis TaxID=1871033 RepID=UPI000987621A|nr:glycosyltransferase family 2 protein [Olsenella urininfantis]
MDIHDDKPRVLLVVPAYNEEGNILSVVRQITEAGYDYVVINDGSTDGTLRVCQANGLNCVDLPINLGIGGAVQTGHRYALEHGYDVDIQVDGDGQHDISYVPRLLEEIGRGADLVIGSRFVGESGGFRSTLLRRIGIKWLEGCIRFVTGLTITDCTSGFRASGRRAMSLFASSYPCDYPEPESIVTAHTHSLVVREVPVIMRERQSGTSSINALRSVYYMVKVTLAVLIEGMGQRGGRK